MPGRADQYDGLDRRGSRGLGDFTSERVWEAHVDLVIDQALAA
jgi:hypothetical protein